MLIAPPRPQPLPSHSTEPELEALIEEARQRARRRRRIYTAVATLAILLGVVGFAVVERTTSGATEAQAASNAQAVSRGAPSGTIALTRVVRGTQRTVLWTRTGSRDPGIRGRAFGWSPDGSRLLVQRGNALHVVRADGSGSVRLAVGAGYEAAWSPDGTKVAFEGGPRIFREGAYYRTIYVVGADGRGLHTVRGLAVGGGFFSGNLTWSPDGTRIVLAGPLPGRSGPGLGGSLYVTRADGTGRAVPIRIRSRLARWRLMQPTWSPDGSTLAFVSVKAGIHLMSPDGTNVRRVASGHGPVWSPDGSMLAFRGNGNQTVHADGTHLTTLPPGSWGGLSWSPNSKLVAFAGGSHHVPNGDVFVVRADGTGLVRILHAPGDAAFLPLWRHGTASTETG